MKKSNLCFSLLLVDDKVVVVDALRVDAQVEGVIVVDNKTGAF